VSAPSGEYADWWAYASSLVKKGYIELGNHSHTHPRGGLVSLIPDYDAIRKNIEHAHHTAQFKMNYDFQVIYCPEGAHDAEISRITNDYYVTNRSVMWGVNAPNTTRYTALYRRANLSDTTLDTLNGYIDEAIQKNGMIILTSHSIKGDPQGGYQPVCLDILRNHYTYMAEKAKEGKVWNGLPSEIGKYIRQRNAAVIETEYDGGQITLRTRYTNTLNATAKNRLKYDYPLTFRTVVPDGWTTVGVVQNGVETTVNAVRENDNTVVYFNAVPNGGDVLISAAQ
jgi:hypothetical protein